MEKALMFTVVGRGFMDEVRQKAGLPGGSGGTLCDVQLALTCSLPQGPAMTCAAELS